MRISSQLLLTFLLNAIWQVALIAVLAALGSWLLRNSVARYRHWLWAGATHVWVNAIDGTIIKTEKELPRKMRSPEGQ